MPTKTYQSRSPQDPEDVLVSAQLVEPAAVPAVVAGARQAQAEWSGLAAPARANALNQAAQSVEQASAELIELGIREVGKPRTEMAGEVARGVSILRYYAQQVLDPDGATFPSSDGRSLLMARRKPHGVVGLITPWNFPVAIPLWKAAPALAFGNGVVLKPARQALATALRLGELISQHLPAGLFEVLAADGAAADVLIGSADAVSFTGSVEVGRHVIAEATGHGAPVQAEMGGQNPSIVLSDADVSRAADAVATAAMSYAGQKCTATSRVIVVGDASNFTDALVAAVEKLPLGDPAEATTVIGPVIDEGARSAVLEAADVARGRGRPGRDRWRGDGAKGMVRGADPGRRYFTPGRSGSERGLRADRRTAAGPGRGRGRRHRERRLLRAGGGGVHHRPGPGLGGLRTARSGDGEGRRADLGCRFLRSFRRS